MLRSSHSKFSVGRTAWRRIPLATHSLLYVNSFLLSYQAVGIWYSTSSVIITQSLEDVLHIFAAWSTFDPNVRRYVAALWHVPLIHLFIVCFIHSGKTRNQAEEAHQNADAENELRRRDRWPLFACLNQSWCRRVCPSRVFCRLCLLAAFALGCATRCFKFAVPHAAEWSRISAAISGAQGQSCRKIRGAERADVRKREVRKIARSPRRRLGVAAERSPYLAIDDSATTD